MRSFLKGETRRDNLSSPLQFSPCKLCPGSKIRVRVTLADYTFLDKRLSINKNVTAILL